MLATKQNMTIGMYTVEACRKKYPIIPIVINPINENPELLQYVPLKHIASYLWITPQSLSRIRAELGRRKKDQ